MRSEVIAILLSVGLAAAPAWAGSAQDKAQDPANQSLGGSPNIGQSDHAQNGLTGAQRQDALKQSLQKAGFSDLQIAAGSYVVHAKGPDGKPVVMMITPDTVAIEKAQSAELPGLDQKGDRSGMGSPSGQSGTGSQDQDQQNTPQQPQND